ncbi:phosphate ABC transporter permease PstA [Hoyosella rhizosphaerae]|uniref:Phosphate transport system permease protein PstA n=1 Tax=Hoyosella rhizosphaerae TaxID=1755582 RepID=A0A916UG94_9ACTN|nr:phosphate ABC transporter permease PstA [Hoyosella rhizosphaerae]MBN4928033.1 phosphate ABC transporter permease PstA [Hoyosella rhizosphaerae]GGC71875.1 phosphate transport system permease protein PstA [Hoyosella rhizosphaerae]
MTTLETPVPAGHRSLRQRAGNAGRRTTSDKVFNAVLTIAMVIAMVPLFVIIGYVTYRGIGVIGWDFFTLEEPPYRRAGGGYVAGFFGTLYIMGLAILMAVPLGIATAIYVVEYGQGKLAMAIRFFSDVMTGIPSIFVGLFVYGLMVSGWISVGFGTFVAAVAIAIIMLPIVTRSAEEMLKLVPDEWRNASYGLGAGKAQTILKTVLPAAAPGLITGSMLAIARGIGETAPLILTALGSVFIVTTLQGDPQAAVPLQIYNGARQPFEEGLNRAFGGALSLFVLVLIMVVAARIIGARANKRK